MHLFLKRLLSHIPTSVPVGMTEFKQWSNDIIELSGEFADRDSMTFALATMLLHEPKTAAYIPKAYFVKCLRKVAANQVVSQALQDIKSRQMEAIEAAKLAKIQTPVEDTTAPVGTSNGQET